MGFFPSFSIKRKLIWIIMCTSGVALALAGTVLAVNDLQAGKHRMLHRLSTQADIVGANSTAALTFNEPLSAKQTLSALSADPPVAAAGIYSRNNTLFASYLRPGANADPLLTELQADSHGFESGHLHVLRPIVLDGEKIGTVYLRADLRELYSQLKDQIMILAAVLLTSSLVALLLSSKLQGMISGPILRLAETAKIISREKNYALRVEKRSQDELGILIQAFNEMLVQIQNRDEKLERHKTQLEVLVATRTAELHKLNEQLKHQAHHLEELVSLRTAELHTLNEQLKHQAYHDTLTGLPNRALFNDRLTQSALHAQRHGQVFAVLFLDLDRFKFINDTLGHAVGDRLLRLVADRLRRLVRKDDTVARLGGDEFTVLLSTIACAEDAVKIAQKIIDSLQRSFVCHGHELHATTSIGIAVHPQDGRDTGTLMRNADTAMYFAKGEGRNNYRLYAAEMHAASLERLEMENRLRHAIARDDFVVHYQPELDIQSGRIVAVEALLRWRHPKLGPVSPAVFVPLLEETGLIVPVGEWVLKSACAQTRAWRDAGLPPLLVAVNCSSRQFNHQKLTETVSQTIRENGLEYDCLTLEITESILVENAEEAVATLHDMSSMGVRLAIDDFGTGYSSLSYLKRFPIDAVKIDKSFVHDITTNPDDAAIVKTIITMAHNLNLKVIAEGVETEEQLAFLRTHQCDTVQGYLFAPPLSSEEFIAYLTDREQSRSVRYSGMHSHE